MEKEALVPIGMVELYVSFRFSNQENIVCWRTESWWFHFVSDFQNGITWHSDELVPESLSWLLYNTARCDIYDIKCLILYVAVSSQEELCFMWLYLSQWKGYKIRLLHKGTSCCNLLHVTQLCKVVMHCRFWPVYPSVFRETCNIWTGRAFMMVMPLDSSGHLWGMYDWNLLAPLL